MDSFIYKLYLGITLEKWCGVMVKSIEYEARQPGFESQLLYSVQIRWFVSGLHLYVSSQSYSKDQMN